MRRALMGARGATDFREIARREILDPSQVNRHHRRAIPGGCYPHWPTPAETVGALRNTGLSRSQFQIIATANFSIDVAIVQ